MVAAASIINRGGGDGLAIPYVSLADARFPTFAADAVPATAAAQVPYPFPAYRAAAQVTADCDRMLVRPGAGLRAVEIQTLPFPGFPTDLQAAFAVLMTQATGLSKVHERVFDDRLRYTAQTDGGWLRERLAP